MNTIQEQATAGMNIIENISDQIASYTVLSNNPNTMMRVFQGMQMELATTMADKNTTTTGQLNEEKALIKESSRVIVEFIKAAADSKQGQLEVLRDIFIGVQQRTHEKI